jgi:shikimate kinase
MTSPAIVLIGPMGAGKTSVGKRVAKRLGLPFTDSDAAIVREHGPIETIFATHGEAHFRELEREAVADALKRAASSHSAGSGAAPRHPGGAGPSPRRC